MDRGFYVFPANKKIPVLKDWPNLASRDKDQVTQWFEGDFKWADGFGVCPKDTCFVIDVDVKDDKKGIESLKYLIDKFQLPRSTFIVRTKNGGLHLYYQYPNLHDGYYIKSIANWNLLNGVELDGIDIRGNKGQVICPTDGNDYSILSDKKIAEIPRELVSHLPIDTTGGTKLEIQMADSLIDKTAASGIKGVIPDVIPIGERHETLLSLTASWARKVPYESAKVLLKEAIDRCEGDDISYADYIIRLDDAYAKFKPVIEDKLQWMLDNLVFVTLGNRVFRADVPANSATILLSEARNAYKNWIIFEESEAANGDIKVKATNAFERWMTHPDREMVENLGYRPNGSDVYVDNISGTNVINTYRAPEFEIVENVEDNQIQPFLDLVAFLWQDTHEIMLDVCAHLVQRPEFKMHWAPLLITPAEGMGKNLFFTCLSKCIGKWNAGTITAGQFNKTFNTFLVQNVVTVISEVQEINKKDRQTMMGKLKTYITESEQPIEGKGIDIYDAEIYDNFFIFSNILDALYIEDATRRFFIHVNHLLPKGQEFYQRVVDWLESETGATYLFNWLSQRDISVFKPVGYAPVTESRIEVIQSNISETELAIMEDIELKISIFQSDIITRESWNHYVNNVLHKGGRMSVAHEKHIKSRLFKGIKYISPGGRISSRQTMLPTINPASDTNLIIRGNVSTKQSMLTCRHHGKYDNFKALDLKSEYDKIFLDTDKDKSNISLIS